VERIATEDALLTAEVALNVPAHELARTTNLPALESALAAPFMGVGDIEFYPEFHVKAAILCSRILRNHPFFDGNKRTAYLVMLMFVAERGRTWDFSDQDRIADIIEALASREITEAEFVEFVAARIE
jgi:death-on-curing protein